MGRSNLLDSVIDVNRRYPPQLAPVCRVCIRPGPVHGRSVVVEHEVSDAPGVTVDKLGLGGVLNQVEQQQPPFGNRPVDDSGGMRRDV